MIETQEATHDTKKILERRITPPQQTIKFRSVGIDVQTISRLHSQNPNQNWVLNKIHTTKSELKCSLPTAKNKSKSNLYRREPPFYDQNTQKRHTTHKILTGRIIPPQLVIKFGSFGTRRANPDDQTIRRSHSENQNH